MITCRIFSFFLFAFILFLSPSLFAHISYAHGEEEHANLPSEVSVCHSLSEAEKEPCYVSLCEGDVTDVCMEDIVDAAAEGSGPKFANAVLHDLVDAPLFVTDGYMLAQRVGRTLFDQEYALAGAGFFMKCSSDFQYGCHYGFFDAFLTLTDIALEEVTFEFCEASLDASEVGMCYHKMGHMFMKHGNHVLAPALSLCDSTSLPHLQSHCWSGVFMENVNVFFVSDDRGDGFSATDPLAPCNVVADVYREQCYENHGRYLIQWFADSPSDVSGACSGAGKYAAVCQHSVMDASSGADAHHTHSHEEQVAASVDAQEMADESSRSWLGRVFDAVAGFFISLFSGGADEAEMREHSSDHAEMLSLAFPDGVSPEAVEHAAMITYEGGAYTPEEVTVQVGQRVLWVNKDQVFWPAANLHPTHKEYPGSTITKCSTDERGVLFDACKAMGPGAAYSFRFDHVGAWRFHDHINPQATGTVIVSE